MTFCIIFLNTNLHLAPHLAYLMYLFLTGALVESFAKGRYATREQTRNMCALKQKEDAHAFAKPHWFHGRRNNFIHSRICMIIICITKKPSSQEHLHSSFHLPSTCNTHLCWYCSLALPRGRMPFHPDTPAPWSSIMYTLILRRCIEPRIIHIYIYCRQSGYAIALEGWVEDSSRSSSVLNTEQA